MVGYYSILLYFGTVEPVITSSNTDVLSYQ
jgi:hypothetical protein